MTDSYIWEVRNPDGGMLGMEVARSIMQPTEKVLGHAFPQRVDVEVRDSGGNLVAKGEGLESGEPIPMARFRIDGTSVSRQQAWPDRSDYGSPVILPGGEVGILKKWWNAEDGSEWRWEVEFYNHV